MNNVDLNFARLKWFLDSKLCYSTCSKNPVLEAIRNTMEEFLHSDRPIDGVMAFANFMDSCGVPKTLVGLESAPPPVDKININISVTLDEAKEVMGNRSNGGLTGISAGKGGRAWLEGEWCLAELEALCVLMRAEAGENASGIMETLKCWENIQIDPSHELPTQFDETMTELASKDKPKQPVYYVSFKDATQAIEIATANHAHYGLAWGNSSPESIGNKFCAMAGTEDPLNTPLNLSKICNYLDSVRTTKLPANANKALDGLIRRLNSVRFEIPAAAKEQSVEENAWVEVPLIKFSKAYDLPSGQRILNSQITGSQMDENALVAALEKFKTRGMVHSEYGFPARDPGAETRPYVARCLEVRLNNAVGIIDASTVKYEPPSETKPGHITALVKRSGPKGDQLDYSKVGVDAIPHFGMRAFSMDNIVDGVHVKHVTAITTFDLITE